MKGGGAIIDALNSLGWAASVGMGLAPLSAVELATFCDRAMVEMGPIDFRDAILASRVFSGAHSRFDGSNVPAPWSRELSPSEQAQHEQDVEAMFDRLFGVG